MAKPPRPAPPPPEPLPFALRPGEERIELQSLLKAVGACQSGGAAKHEIQAGRVRVNGEVETHRSRGLVRGDLVALGRRAWRVA